MKQLVTTGIVLSRTNYGEADRIITVLTPDHGKLRLMAKGVRRVKSKLAGGIELFSVSQITFIHGRGEIGMLVSTRLQQHYGHIIHDMQRVQLGYELTKLLHKITEDETGSDYFDLLEQTFRALDDPEVGEELIRAWFCAQLLRFGGHTPNLQTDASGLRLELGKIYDFDFDSVAFAPYARGKFTADHIKFLRLIFSPNQPHVLQYVAGQAQLLKAIGPIVQTMLNTFIRV